MTYNIIHTPQKGILKLFFGCFFAINALALEAQVNAFVGYAYSINNDGKVFNSIIERYNAQNPDLLQPMSSLKFLHGVDLGIRYRMPSISFEFNWINKINQIHDRVLANDNTQYRNTIFYKSQTLCLGTEVYYEWFGIGASLDWNHLQIKKERSTENVKERLISQSGFSNHIFLNFEFDMNDVTAVSIRPFIQIPTYKNNFYAVDENLNPNTASMSDSETYKTKVINWGIKLLFVNGNKIR